MSQDSATDLRRITLVSPQGRFDLAVPAAVPLAYLVPALLRQAGEELADAGVGHGGWVVQRLGAAPFDTGQSAVSLGISDGEVLYLRPRTGELPPPVYDDTAEAINAALAGRTARWSGSASRIAGLCAAIALSVAGTAALALAGPPWPLPTTASATVAVVLLIAAGFASRAADDAVAGTVLGCAAAGYGAVGAFLHFAHQHSTWTSAGSAGVIAGSAAALVLSAVAGAVVGVGHQPSPAAVRPVASAAVGAGHQPAIAGTAVGGSTPVFAAAAFVSAAGILGGLVAAHTSSAGGAAASLALAFLAAPFLPMAAYRLAGLPKPFLPTTADQLRAGSAAPSGEELAHRAVLADRYISSLIAACTLTTVAASGLLARSSGWAGPVLAGVTGLLVLSRSRHYSGRTQKIWLLTAGIAIVGIAIGGAAHRLAGEVSAVVFAALAAVSAPAILAASGREELSASPPTRRLLDLAELLSALATVPLALEVLGVYSHLRTLFG